MKVLERKLREYEEGVDKLILETSRNIKDILDDACTTGSLSSFDRGFEITSSMITKWESLALEYLSVVKKEFFKFIFSTLHKQLTKLPK